MARPSKLTPELQDNICKLIEEGNYPAQAAELEGIAESTFYSWMKKGREAKYKSKFMEFVEAIKKAESKAEQFHINVIKNAASKNWTASAWYLERKHPDRWGKQTKMEMEHSGEVKQEHKGSIEVNIHDRIKQYEERFKQMDTPPESTDSSDNIR